MIHSYCKRSDSSHAVFSVVIPSWNNLELLKLCIRSIRENATFSHQVIVHVNEGTDGTLDWIIGQQDIDYTYSQQNVGVCFALNAARSIVATDYLLFLNDDMYLCPGWDTALQEEVRTAGNQPFFLSATVIEPVASSICAIGADYGRDVASFQEQRLLDTFMDHKKSDWAGATWPPNLLPVKLWDLVGGYSIEFSPGLYSDPDFSLKLWKAGVRYFKGVSNSRAYHFGSTSVKRKKMNHGYHKFIQKWGFSSSFLTNKMLKRGLLFKGPMPDVRLDGPQRILQWFKRTRSAMKYRGI
jgi:GT2 family glycosyltransferase